MRGAFCHLASVCVRQDAFALAKQAHSDALVYRTRCAVMPVDYTQLLTHKLLLQLLESLQQVECSSVALRGTQRRHRTCTSGLENPRTEHWPLAALLGRLSS